MSGAAPPGLAKFDSAAALARALARFLHGRDFPRLGQSRILELPVALSNRIPREWRNRIFARFGAVEGVRPDQVDEVDTERIAAWAADLYPRRRYPVVFVGSSSGALIHLAALLDAPWLPQTFLTLVRQSGIDKDRPAQALDFGREPGRRFLAANPLVQLHHMHDSSQDRLMLDYITYFRWKFRRLPAAYRDFLVRRIEPGGTLVLSDCGVRWPTTRVDERHLFQFGALGGPTRAEYLEGSKRVAHFLASQGSELRRWHPPAPDGEELEAEWGFESALEEDLAELAREQGWRMARLRYEYPDDLSPPVADLYRSEYRRRGLPDHRLAVESFILTEPYWALRTASVPFWMKFNMEDSLRRVRSYLDRSGPFDRILLMLFAHGVDSIGLPPISDWSSVLAEGREGGSFLGVDPAAYPSHFAGFARYSQQLRDSGPHFPLPEPIPLETAAPFLSGRSGSTLSVSLTM